MLEPSLLAPAEYYNTPNSEKGLPSKKRQVSPQRSAEPDSQDDAPVHPGLERRVSDITSDISLDNLLEGSRRKRNKFSSDLPLVPLPTPASAVPVASGHARTKSYARDRAYSGSTTGTNHQTPGRVSIPTPAPTTISDEDVALQLIRLGDPSLSPYKAPSNESSSPIPNLTTALQLKALRDGTDVKGSLGPARREVDYPSSPPASVSDTQDRPAENLSSTEKPGYEETVFKMKNRDSFGSTVVESEYHLKDETDVEDEIDIPRPQNLPHFHDSMQCKASSAHEIDLPEDKPKKSSGPSVGVRCTRCKKSKKGCDRQRPCGRCADANEDCVTEDESSGRRGRNSRGGRRGKR